MAEDDFIGIPTVQEAEAFLKEAGALNPGAWVEHSIYTGNAARRIAQHCKDIKSAFGRWDCTEEEYEFIRQPLKQKHTLNSGWGNRYIAFFQVS